VELLAVSGHLTGDGGLFCNRRAGRTARALPRRHTISGCFTVPSA
jgi:hypothetical protein